METWIANNEPRGDLRLVSLLLPYYRSNVFLLPMAPMLMSIKFIIYSLSQGCLSMGKRSPALVRPEDTCIANGQFNPTWLTSLLMSLGGQPRSMQSGRIKNNQESDLHN